MHKARENNDGTFSIGKTWMLDDLSSIQSYSAWTPTSPMEQQYKQWASNVGFTVNVGKPYYWHARTAKEKEFFIGSLVKIYRKYTGGKVPNLIGFDERERQLLAGAPSSGPPPMGPPGVNARGPGPGPGPARPDVTIPPPRPVSPQGGRPQSPYSSRAQSRDGPRRLPSEEQSLRAQRSREQMTRPSTGNSGRSGPSPFAPSQHPPPPPPFPMDQRNQPPPRSADRMAPENKMPKAPMHLPPESARGKEIPGSLLAASPTGPRERPSGDFEESKSATSQSDSRPPSSRDQMPLPEPRSMFRSHDSSSSSPDPGRNKDSFRPTTPKTSAAESQKATQSPGSHRGRPEGPPRLPLLDTQPEPADKDSELSLDLPPAVIAAAVPPALNPASSGAGSAPVTADPAGALTSDNTKETEPSEPTPDSAPISPPSSPSEPSSPSGDGATGAHRPGLGPMIKKKQSKDMVGAFRKPVTTQGAFKPRPGGAGERLMAAAKRQKAEMSEPDGITGVVPAPFLRTNQESENAATPDTPEKETPPSVPVPATAPAIPSPTASPSNEPPTVEVTQPAADEAPAVPVLEVPEEPRDTSRATVKVDANERTRSVSPSPHDRRRRRHEDNTIKYCQALGIEPGVLEGRGVDFDDILTDLGWNGRLNDEKKIEDLEADIRREIGRVEATSWLGNLEQQEGKVDQLARLIDRTVEECEELDNLLTLYSHELNVSPLPQTPTICPIFKGPADLCTR